MAKIIIELDTEKGDTLETALLALIEDVGDRFDPNAYKPTAQAEEAWKTYQKQDEPADTPTMAEIAEAMKNGTAKFVSPVEAPVLTLMDGDRKRGEAGPGHRRRTNAQIEEDKLYFAQVEAAKADAARAASGVPPVTFKTFDDGKHALATMDAGVETHPDQMKIPGVDIDLSGGRASFTISTDAERVNPQDEADEAAETAARPKSDGEPTLEDLRAAYARYAAKFGAPAAIKDIRTILGCGVSAVPPDKIAEGIAKIDAAIAAENIDAHLAETTVNTIQTESAEVAPPATFVSLNKEILFGTVTVTAAGNALHPAE